MYFTIYTLSALFAFTLSLVRGHDVKESFWRAPLGPLYITYALYQILAGDKKVYIKEEEEKKEKSVHKNEKIVIKF